MTKELDLENDMWVYDPAIDAPRLATKEDFDEMRNSTAAFGAFKALLRDLCARRSTSAEEHLAWVRAVRESVAPLLK